MSQVRLSRRGILLGSALALVSVSAARAAGEPRSLVAAPAPGGGFTFDGSSPGPLLRVRRGDEVAVRLLNRLDVPTTLHWHGVRIANAMDGAAGLTQAAVAPGESFDYRFTTPDAGLFWYRPEVGPATAAQVAGGLYGLLIVDEAEAPVVDREVILVIAEGPGGPRVNGRAVETLEAARHERVRIRLLNACPGRMANLAFGGFSPLVAALDGQPANEAFAPAGSRLDLPPGGRADLFADLALDAGQAAGIAMLVDGAVKEILHLSAKAGEPARSAPLPDFAGLPSNGLPEDIALGEAARLDLDLVADGASLDAAKPLVTVPSGKPVVVGLANKTDAPFAVHLHGHAMRVLHPFDDGWEPYWLDTVLVGPNETIHVAFVADNPGKWLIRGVPVGVAGAGTTGWVMVEG